MVLGGPDLALRGLLTRRIAELGHAPSNAALAEALRWTEEEVEASLRRLHDAHALQLHPHACVPWAVHPFALSPGSCWVEAKGRGWWANCLYCGFGLAAALKADAVIATRLGGEREAIEVRIEGGKLEETGLLFHLSTRVRHWWDNVIHACATFQPFRTEAEVDDWCRRHSLPKGAVVPLPAMWRFASDWYGDYLTEPWRRRTPEEASELFARHGFTGDFWAV